MTFRNEEPHVNMSFPRVRGDVPGEIGQSPYRRGFSPRARGCSVMTVQQGKHIPVFPACAGMFRCDTGDTSARSSFPRVRGDVPNAWEGVKQGLAFSPRARGCSAETGLESPEITVFPACAGMFRIEGVSLLIVGGFPRVRGDVPASPWKRWKKCSFSPRARGCSYILDKKISFRPVFPACAGMFL